MLLGLHFLREVRLELYSSGPGVLHWVGKLEWISFAHFFITISPTRDEEGQERVGVGVGDDVVEEDREV